MNKIPNHITGEHRWTLGDWMTDTDAVHARIIEQVNTDIALQVRYGILGRFYLQYMEDDAFE